MSCLAELDRLIVDRLGEKCPILVALDGRSGVGKTTVAARLAERHHGAAILADDFYAGGCDADWLRLLPADRADRAIDWRRLRSEALEPLLSGKPATWRPFDFDIGHGLSGRTLFQSPVPVLILDGAYSSRPELADLVDVSVLVVVDDATRRRRLLAREGNEFMGRWHTIWDSAEDHYFSKVRSAADFDLTLHRH